MRSRFFGKSGFVCILILVAGLAACGFCMASATDNGWTDTPILTDEPLVADGGWKDFNWVGGDGVFDFEGAFLFTTDRVTLLKVTDVRCKGDQFRI
jgi:hypothetical protein